MSRPLLILDVDACVRRPAVGDHINEDPYNQTLRDGATDALIHYKEADKTIVGISNQSGVHAGYKSLGNAIDEQAYTLATMAPEMEAIFFSPDSNGARCFQVTPDGSVLTVDVSMFAKHNVRSFRLPAMGMIVLAMLRYGATPETTLVVGCEDKARLAAADAACEWMCPSDWYQSRLIPMGAAIHE